MDIDQLEKKIEWLDKERQADKKTIAEMQKQITELGEHLEKSNGYIKELTSEVTRMGVVMTKVEEYDDALSAHRAEVKKELEAGVKRAKDREKTAKTRIDKEISDLTKSFGETKGKVDTLDGLRKDLLIRQEEDERRYKTVIGFINEYEKTEAERNQTFRSMEQVHKQDVKLLTDLQGEIAALRKRSDEMRGRMDIFIGGQKKSDARVNELIATESERLDAQAAFMEKVSMEKSDRDKTWKEWSKRFDTIEKQSEELAQSLKNVMEAEQAVKKAEKALEEITAQINRRIHEITEMQRLGEERFRQEWSTFKVDDQKRWTNYNLTQEEQQREMNRRLERLTDRTTTLEEIVQDMQDTVQNLSEQSEKLMQTMLAGIRDFLSENERFETSNR